MHITSTEMAAGNLWKTHKSQILLQSICSPCVIVLQVEPFFRIYIKSDIGHNLKVLDVEWRIILKWILKKWLRGMHRVYLPQYRNRYRALLKAVMNLRVP